MNNPTIADQVQVSTDIVNRCNIVYMVMHKDAANKLKIKKEVTEIKCTDDPNYFVYLIRNKSEKIHT